MKPFFVLLHNFNLNKPEKYDIMVYLLNTYKECKEKKYWWPMFDTLKAPTTKQDFMSFVARACQNQYWSRCQYEWLMLGWPPGKTDSLEDCLKVINKASKIDAWEQIEMNLEIVTDVFMENIKEL